MIASVTPFQADYKTPKLHWQNHGNNSSELGCKKMCIFMLSVRTFIKWKRLNTKPWRSVG